jgi:hypothetical protein
MNFVHVLFQLEAATLQMWRSKKNLMLEKIRCPKGTRKSVVTLMFCQLRAPKLPLGGLGVPSI